MEENDLLYKIRGAIYDTYYSLGPGLLEKVYEEVLCYCLEKRGLKTERQVKVPIIYDGKKLCTPLYIDILVNREIIIELKAVKDMCELYQAQLLTYLKLTGLHRGILVNFNTLDINKSIQNIVNGYTRRTLDESANSTTINHIHKTPPTT